MNTLLKTSFFLAFILFSFTVHAYTRSGSSPQSGDGLKWDIDTPYPSSFFSEGRLVYSIITSGTYAVPDQDRISNIVNAFQTWEDVETSTLAFKRGSDADTTVDTESVFTLGYSSSSYLTQWGADMTGSVGLSSYSYIGSNIVNTDICFKKQTWDDELEETAIHEIGHSIGFQHNFHAQSPMSYISSIHPGIDEHVADRLTEDDIIGLSIAYPADGYTATRGTLSGTIQNASSQDISQAQISIYDSNGFLVATTLSENGVYEYKGLSPGTYSIRVYMSPSDSWLVQPSSTLAFGPASTFAYTDGYSATITAGNTTTKNIIVNTGTPSMNIDYGWYKSDSTNHVVGRAFQLEKGETAYLGVNGPNIPSSSSELQSLSLTGSGITISDITYKSWPTDNTTTATFTVSPSAETGARALILEDSDGEIIYVNGFIEVYEKGALTAAEGAANPSAGSISDSESKVMAQVSMTADSIEPIRLRKWTLSTGGTGSTSTISEISVYHDADSDGTVDSGDNLLGTGNISDGLVYTHHTVPAGTAQNFLIVYTFTDSLTDSATYSTSLTSLSASGLTSGRNLTTSGLSFDGNTHSVSAPVTVSFVLSSSTVNVPEGDTASFTVKLSAQPSQTISVTVEHSSGDSDISVSSGSSLTFTTSNWDTAKTVILTAAEDSDTIDSNAAITLTASAEVTADMVTASEDDDAVTLNILYSMGGTASGGGTVDPDLGPFTITATPSGGYDFSGWSTTGGTITSTSSESTTINGLTGNTTVTASFSAISAPAISTHPQSATVTAGDSISLSVTASGDSLTYQWKKDGTAIPSATSSSILLSPARPASAGDYTCLVSNEGGSTESNAATITVNKKTLTVTADSTSKTYGDDDPTFTVSYNGFISGDDSSDLEGTLTFSTNPNPAVNAGAYALTPSGLSSDDYSFTYEDGVFTINKATLTITADDKIRAPGENNPAFTSTASGLQYSDTVESAGLTVTYTAGAEDGSATEGTFAITPSGSSSTTNYTVSYVAGTLTVTSETIAAVDLVLQAGWNLFSLPLNTSVTASNLLIDDNTDSLVTGSLWKWDGQNGMYDELTESVPALDGFWAYSTTGGNAQTITGTDGAGTVSLYTGWNLVGVSTSTAVSSLPSSVVAIWKWNAETQTYSQKTSGDILGPAEGYWLYLNQDESVNL